MEIDNDGELIDSPASRFYWEKFYEEGFGKKQCEWYETSFEDVRKEILQNLKPGSRILQIGIGNSLILEEIMEDPRFPGGVQVFNIDISEAAIVWMKKWKKNTCKSVVDFNFDDNLSDVDCISSGTRTLKSTSYYLCMDACEMKFESEMFDIVFDKGTVSSSE